MINRRPIIVKYFTFLRENTVMPIRVNIYDNILLPQFFPHDQGTLHLASIRIHLFIKSQ